MYTIRQDELIDIISDRGLTGVLCMTCLEGTMDDTRGIPLERGSLCICITMHTMGCTGYVMNRGYPESWGPET